MSHDRTKVSRHLNKQIEAKKETGKYPAAALTMCQVDGLTNDSWRYSSGDDNYKLTSFMIRGDR